MEEDSSELNVSKKFTRLYSIALSAVAVLSIVGQLLVQRALDEQSNDSRVVNMAGRQRMLSQKICKEVLRISLEVDSSNKEVNVLELTSALALWYNYHVGLKSGNLDTLQGRLKNSDTILKLFMEIEPNFLTIYKQATILAETISIATPAFRNKVIIDILSNEPIFLKGMDKIVSVYAQEATGRVDMLKRVEVILLLMTLAILLFEGLFIFKPAVAKLRSTIKQLVTSEHKAKEINKKLAKVNESLKKTELELLNATQEKYKQQISEQKIRSTSLVKGQERERKRIARDIHDGVGQMLTALKLNIESISTEGLSEKERVRLEEARSLIGKTIVETRTITFNLMPSVLSDFGIISAIKQLADQSSKSSDVVVVFSCPNEFNRLIKDIEIGLYRICQEAINNAIKYAQAKEITIELLINDNYSYLTIVDNGKGFNNKRPALDSDHIKINNGIFNMQERTNLLDGEFKIISSFGKGTKIYAKIPVNYQ